MGNSTNTIIIFLGCIIGIMLFGKMLILPIKLVIKLILNSAIGGLIIIITNWVGAIFNLHIGLNIFTAIFVGILGVPGAILLLIFKLVLH